jgi:hypothetical protein
MDPVETCFCRRKRFLAKALCAYYAGGAAVTYWANMRADCKRYVWAVYNAAIMFKQGRGPA